MLFRGSGSPIDTFFAATGAVRASAAAGTCTWLTESAKAPRSAFTLLRSSLLAWLSEQLPRA